MLNILEVAKPGPRPASSFVQVHDLYSLISGKHYFVCN